MIPEHLAGARLPRGARELTSLHEHSPLSHTKSPEHQVPGWAVTSWGYSRTARIFSFCRPVGAACSSVRGLPAKLSGCLTHTTGSWPPLGSLPQWGQKMGSLCLVGLGINTRPSYSVAFDLPTNSPTCPEPIQNINVSRGQCPKVLKGVGSGAAQAGPQSGFLICLSCKLEQVT